MRVLCCPANSPLLGPRPHPLTQECLRLHAPNAEIVDVTGDDFGYWSAIVARWNGDDDLVIVEHDNTFTAEQLQSFIDCPEPWCSFGYLRFTRFRKELMADTVIDQFPVWKEEPGYGVPVELEIPEITDCYYRGRAQFGEARPEKPEWAARCHSCSRCEKVREDALKAAYLTKNPGATTAETMRTVRPLHWSNVFPQICDSMTRHKVFEHRHGKVPNYNPIYPDEWTS